MGYSPDQLRRWQPAPTSRERTDQHPGQDGAGVSTDPEEAKARFAEHQFNILASDQIPLDRTLKESRHKA